MRFRLRVRDGKLLPLEGAVRAVPDTLQLSVDAFVKILFFNVGVTNMRGDLTIVRSDHERSWVMRFDREPEWHLPPMMSTFVRTPLRRPFQQGGILLRVGFVDGTATGQTLLTRRFDVAVKESGLVRWLGGLGSTAMGDFAGRAETEENRFIADAFQAMRADVKALTF
jgi:hypothetical protein